MKLLSKDYTDYLDHRPSTPWTQRQSAPWKLTLVATVIGVIAGLIVASSAGLRDASAIIAGGFIAAITFDSWWRYVREANAMPKHDADNK